MNKVSYLFSKLSGNNNLYGFLIKSISTSFSIRVVSIGSMFLCQIVLARICGVEDYGYYVFINSWVAIISLFTVAGLDIAALRFIPDFRSKSEWGIMKGFILWSRMMVILFSLIVSLVLFMIFAFVFGFHSRTYVILFGLTITLVLINSQLALGSNILLALKKVSAGLIPIAVVRPMLLAISVFVVGLYTNNQLTAATVILLDVTLGLGMLFLILFFIKIYIPFETTETIRKEVFPREWLKVSFMLLFVSGIGLLFKQLDVVLLGLLRSTNEAGIYSAASQIALTTSFVLTAVNIVVAPKISELYSNGKYDQLQIMVFEASKIVIVFSTLVFY